MVLPLLPINYVQLNEISTIVNAISAKNPISIGITLRITQEYLTVCCFNYN